MILPAVYVDHPRAGDREVALAAIDTLPAGATCVIITDIVGLLSPEPYGTALLLRITGHNDDGSARSEQIDQQPWPIVARVQHRHATLTHAPVEQLALL